MVIKGKKKTSHGFISIVDNSNDYPNKILRDTGSSLDLVVGYSDFV